MNTYYSEAIPPVVRSIEEGVMRAHAFGLESGDLAPIAKRLYPDVPFPIRGEVHALVHPAAGHLMAIEDGGLLNNWQRDSAGNWLLASRLELEEFASSWCLSPHGTYAIGASGEDLSCWNATTGELVWTAVAPDWITALAVDQHGKSIATGHDDGSIMVWDINRGACRGVIGASDNSISSVSFNPDGTTVAAADESCVITIWALEHSEIEPRRLIGHKGRIVALVWDSTTGYLLSAAWDTTVRVWDVVAARPVILLNDHTGHVTALAISPDGKNLTSTDSSPSWRTWDMGSWRCLSGARYLPGEARHLSYSPDGQSLAIGLEKSQIMRIPAGQIGTVFVPDPSNPWTPRSGLFYGSDDQIIALDSMGQLTFWPMDSWSMETAPVEREDPGARFHSMAVDGNIILALDRLERRRNAHSSGVLALSRLEGPGGRITRLVNLEGPAQPASCLALHVAAGVAASASPMHPDIWLWSVPEGKPRILISDPLKAASIQDLAFSPDGRLLAVTGIHAVGSGGQTVVIDAITGCEIAGGNHAAWRVAWHPDGKALAVIEQRGQVAILDAQCQLIGRLRGITDAIQVLAFSTDGNWLVAAGEDRILRVWPAEGGKPVAALELSSHAGALRALPDPDQMAVLLSDGGVWVIDLPTLMEGHPA